MTKKKTESTKEPLPIFYFPTLGISVAANSYDEALNSDEVKTALEPAEKDEGGDVDS